MKMSSTTNRSNNDGEIVDRGILPTENNSNGNTIIETEYNRISDRSGLHKTFQEIREKCDREANEKQFSTGQSKKSQNRCLNRYRDVNPYDHSRIVLHRGSVDYINANLVELKRANRAYILTQGPLGDTVGHFWLMVWEQNTKAILMLNKIIENKQIKCHMYWPQKQGPENSLKLDEVDLNVEFLRCEGFKNYCRRWFKLTDLRTNQSREIMQFHYTTWPDFGIPSSPVTFLQFLKQVRDCGALDPEVGPAVVHCSAGIGRSGTFCLVDCCLVLVDKEEENVSVKDVLYELRKYRMGLIQTADQLYFSYQAIMEGIKLLKDSNFLEYKETPIISSEGQQPDQYNMDETPPPLPPRTHSLLPLADSGMSGGLTLNLRGTQSKPLPKIPASESFNDDLYVSNNLDHQVNNKDALNNFINSEQSNDITMSNRPLPPLPAQQQNSLDLVHESESDENELYESDSDEDANTNADADVNAKIADAVNANSEPCEPQSHLPASTKKSTDEKKINNINAIGELHNAKELNGIDPISSVHLSPENELKRRKRVERQSNIEQKVNEIKRKQRETEEGKQSAKKRRSLVTYIAAGVIVGVICVYAYSKLA